MKSLCEIYLHRCSRKALCQLNQRVSDFIDNFNNKHFIIDSISTHIPLTVKNGSIEIIQITSCSALIHSLSIIQFREINGQAAEEEEFENANFMFSGANAIFIGQITGKIKFIFRNFDHKMGQLKCESFIFGRIWLSFSLSSIGFIQLLYLEWTFLFRLRTKKKSNTLPFVSSAIVYWVLMANA